MASRRPARAGGGRRRRCRDAIARWCRTSPATARRCTGRRASTPARRTSARSPRRAPSRSCGYSMGGRIALHTALTLGPEIVTRLVLVGASPGIADPAERAAAPRRRRRARRPHRDARHRGLRARMGRAAAVRRPAGARRGGRLRGPAAQHAAPASRRRCAASGPASWSRSGTGWSELAIPVTLIVGERDEKFRAHRRGDASSAYRTRSSWWCAGAGHAVAAGVAERGRAGSPSTSPSPSSSASA